MKVDTVNFNHEIIIREANVNDAEQVLLHTTTVAEETNFLLTSPEEMTNFTLEDEEKWIRSHIEQPNWLLLVAEVRGEIVGLLSFRNSDRIRASHRGLFGISIKQAWTNKGIGKEMIKLLLKWAEDNTTIEKVCLEVFSHNSSAIHLYEKLGFKREGIREKHVKYSDGTYQDEILMYKFV